MKREEWCCLASPSDVREYTFSLPFVRYRLFEGVVILLYLLFCYLIYGGRADSSREEKTVMPASAAGFTGWCSEVALKQSVSFFYCPVLPSRD